MSKKENIKNINKKKKHIIIKILLSLFILLIILFISLPYIVLYSSPFLVKKFLKLNFKFEQAKYNPFKLNLSISGLTISSLDDKQILSSQQIYIDVNLKKTLLLKPTISTIHLDKISLFVFHSKKGYSLPIKFNTFNKNSYNFNFSKLPFSVDEIEITDSNIVSYSKNKIEKINPITNLNIFIPGINSSQNAQTIHPKISGKYFGKNFKLVGTTVLTESKLINKFEVNLVNLDLKQIATLIPPIQGIQIISGLISTDLDVKFITSNTSKPMLKLSGSLIVHQLKLFDTNAKINFLSNLNGRVQIKEYDIFRNNLQVNSTKVTSGKLLLSFANKNNKKSVFFLHQKNNLTKPFDIFVKKLKATKFNVTIIDNINKKNYNFINSSIQLNDFSIDKNSSFNLSTHSDYIDNIEASGLFNIEEKKYLFKKLFIKKGNLKKNPLFSLFTKKFISTDIEEFHGSLSFSKDNVFMAGKIFINLFEINQAFGLKKIFIDIKNIDIHKKIIQINSASLKNGYIKSPKKTIEDIQFVVPEKKKSYDFIIDPKKELITIKEPISIENVQGIFTNKLSQFSFDAKSALFNIKEIKYNGKKKANINIKSSRIDINNITIIHKTITFVRLKKLEIALTNYKSHPFILAVSNLKITNPFVKLILDKNRKLQIFPKLFNNSQKNKNISLNIDLDKTEIVNGSIDFSDNSLSQPFFLQLSQINGLINNYPSTVYPEGNFSFSSKLNDRNEITLTGKIDKPMHIAGFCATKYLSLPLFTPYAKEYLGYSITSGNLDFNAPFEFSKKQFKTDLNIDLKEPSLLKEIENKSKIDLSRILILMKNSNGDILDLKIPIKGDYNKPDVDLRKIFFQSFAKIISNFSKIIMKNFTQFKQDNTMEIIYFSPGTNKILATKNIFSNKMLSMFKDNNKYFIINGFVDKVKDTPFLLNNILERKIISITGRKPEINSTEEKKALQMLFAEVTGKPPQNSLTNETLKKIIKEQIIVRESDYYALSFARIAKVRNILIEKYRIPADKIGLSEKSIFENPYISGISNTIAIVISGNKY